MKQILGIIGSPRRNGNTHLLVSRILEGAGAAGAGESLILLNDLVIRACDGCHVCWKGKPCSKQDDMHALYTDIISSDVLVLGTPVYWYGPTALMKGFIDRFVYFNCPENRVKIRNKGVILAIPFEETDPATAALTIEFFQKSLGYLEMNLLGIISVPGVTARGEILQKKDTMEEAYTLGYKAGSNEVL